MHVVGPFLLSLLFLVVHALPAAAVVSFVEAYVDGVAGVDGLDMVQDIVVSPNGAHAYAVSEGDSAVVRFDRDPATGALTFVDTLVDGENGVNGISAADAVDISPDGASLYVAGPGENAVAVFTRGAVTGALTFLEAEVNGQGGVSGLTVPLDLKVSPDGTNVYALAFTPGAVVTFDRDPVTGALTFVEKDEEAVGGLDAIEFPQGLALSPDGQNVYVAAQGEDSVAVFARDSGTGALTFVEVHRDGVNGVDGINGSFAVAVSPDGESVYAGGADDDGLAVFARDAGTGALTFVQSLHDGMGGVDGLNFPRDITVTADGSYVLVVAASDAKIGVFERDAGTGALTFVQAVPAFELDGASSLTVAPGGQHLYATGRSSNTVSLFTVTVTATTTTSSTAVTTSSSTTSTTHPLSTTTTSTPSPTSTIPPITTTTTLPSECTGVPEGATFVSILCRLGALRTRVATESGLGNLGPKLGGALERATSRATAARDLCAASSLKKARQRLKQGERVLKQYARPLSGRVARKTIPAELREQLRAAGSALRSDVVALRKALSCPAGAAQKRKAIGTRGSGAYEQK